MRMTRDEQALTEAKAAARVAWERFCNGLKIDGRQRHEIIRMKRAYADRIRELEQREYNLTQALERARDGRS